MREYLYIWNNPEEQFLVASGIEFKDLFPSLESAGGLILLKHKADAPDYDRTSGLEFVPISAVPRLLNENIYSWGDFCWVDYSSREFPRVSKQELAELFYFAHRAEKFENVHLPGLGNRFLAYAHDDGWYLKCYYSEWDHAQAVLDNLVLLKSHQHVTESIRKDNGAFWISGGIAEPEERTFNIDSVMNRRFSRRLGA